jgi:hypothetical protein
MDWGLQFMQTLFYKIWRLDWFVSNVFQQEKIDSNFSQSFLYNTLYSNQKLKGIKYRFYKHSQVHQRNNHL